MLNILNNALQHASNSGLHRVLLKQLVVVSAENGTVVCNMPVEEIHLNRDNTLHGGVTATLVDIGGSLAISYLTLIKINH
jgi:uncharacterized protein (TIGR00369 family)